MAKTLRPIATHVSKWGTNTEIVFKCPNCNTSFAYYGEKEAYCHLCGTEIDWRVQTRLDAPFNGTFDEEQKLIQKINKENLSREFKIKTSLLKKCSNNEAFYLVENSMNTLKLKWIIQIIWYEQFSTEKMHYDLVAFCPELEKKIDFPGISGTNLMLIDNENKAIEGLFANEHYLIRHISKFELHNMTGKDKELFKEKGLEQFAR